MKIEDVKVKVVVDDAQARAIIDELMRGAAAMEQLLVGLGKALSSDAGQAVVIDALVGHIEELKKQLSWARDQNRNPVVDVAALLREWRPGVWHGFGSVGRSPMTWWSDAGELVHAVLEDHGRWKADLELDGAHVTFGFGDNPAQAVLAMIEQDAFGRGVARERAKGGA